MSSVRVLAPVAGLLFALSGVAHAKISGVHCREIVKCQFLGAAFGECTHHVFSFSLSKGREATLKLTSVNNFGAVLASRTLKGLFSEDAKKDHVLYTFSFNWGKGSDTHSARFALPIARDLEVGDEFEGQLLSSMDESEEHRGRVACSVR